MPKFLVEVKKLVLPGSGLEDHNPIPKSVTTKRLKKILLSGKMESFRVQKEGLKITLLPDKDNQFLVEIEGLMVPCNAGEDAYGTVTGSNCEIATIPIVMCHLEEILVSGKTGSGYQATEFQITRLD